MKDKNPRQDGVNQQDLDATTLDHELDVALTKLAAVAPRAGLEERILESLRAHQEGAAHSWWRWPALATLAAVMVAVLILWRSEKPAHDIAAHTPAITQPNKNSETQFANDGGRASIRPEEVSGRRPKPHVSSRPASVPIAPKLDQFPSPQPLSEQERMLTEYVAEHHQQAALVARARMAELKKDLAEEMAEASATSGRQTSDPSVSQQEDR